MKTLIGKFTFFLYDIIFILGFIIYLPVYFSRKKINLKVLKEKFGFIGEIRRAVPSIWIQAVSVGEVNLLENLIKKLKQNFDYPIIISTTTLTGNHIAKQRYSSLARIIFFPFDISFVLGRVLRIIKPKIFISLETEIWPNLFRQLKRRNIPALIINGRISDLAFKKYCLVKPIIALTMNRCRYIGVQNEAYKKKFLKLGARQEKIVVSGNMKFESLNFDQDKLSRTKSRYESVLKKDGKILIIAGSTHSPEEKAIIKAYKDIYQENKNINLLIVPRHPERTQEIEKIITEEGFKPLLLSQAREPGLLEKTIFVVDTIGLLFYLYAFSDICFVGGSLFGHGGQNILEPIYFHKPTIFGPEMENFIDIEKIVLEKGAGIKLNNPAELTAVLSGLVNDTALRANLANKCQEVFESADKSLNTNFELILKCLN